MKKKSKKNTTKKKTLKKQTNEKKNKIQFWLQILIILLTGFLVSIAVFFIVSQHNGNQNNNMTTLEFDGEKHTITFAYQDGEEIERKKVSDGKGVFPPDIDFKGVFRGWSAPINHVASDIEVHPMIMDITDENLFYFDSVYVKEGDEFTIVLNLDGKVSLSSAELIVSYDEEVMEFVKSEDGDNCSATKDDKNELTVKVNSKTPVAKKHLISKLTFRAKEKDVYATEIELKCKNGKTKKEGKEVPATVSTINNKIYYLQEVD